MAEDDIVDRIRKCNGDPKYWQKRINHLADEAADEIERLQAIVDKLPKTADGVSVFPGESVWIPVAFIPKLVLRKLADAPVPHIATVRWSEDWEPEGSYDVAIYRQHFRVDCGYSVEQCYSTREAAKAAGGDDG